MNINSNRYVVLDTETTGMNKFGVHYEGHRIIEIGAVEIINRRLTNNQFHVYLNPNRSVDSEAFAIHGISDQFLVDQPCFLDIANDFLQFIRGSTLVIHNASFDLGFLDFELHNIYLNSRTVESYCTVIDSLKLARKIFPGQRNSLDALCERYCIKNSKRILHNALIDAQLLAYVFLVMTGGQTRIQFMDMLDNSDTNILNNTITHDNKFELCLNNSVCTEKKSLKILYATSIEKLEHEKYLDFVMKASNNQCLWRKCK